MILFYLESLFFVVCISVFYELINRAKILLAKAVIDRLIQSILAKAFRGELVPQDSSDEPVAQLLATIQEAMPKSKAKVGEKAKTV